MMRPVFPERLGAKKNVSDATPNSLNSQIPSSAKQRRG
jgi:hypothetical protein